MHRRFFLLFSACVFFMAKRKSSPPLKSKSSGRKSSSARASSHKRLASSRRRSSRIRLDKGKVSLLCSIVFLGCCLCIAVNVLLSPSKPSAETEQKKAQEVSRAESAQDKREERIEKELSSSSEPAIIKDTEKKPEPAPKAAEGARTDKKMSAPQSSPPAVAPLPKDDKKKPVQQEIPSSSAGQAKDNKSVSALSPQKEEKRKEENPFQIPPAQNGATIVLVIDDAGLNAEYTRRYASLPFPLTIAVLPRLSHTKDCAYIVRSSGKELILHQPMQSLNHNLDPGPGKVTVDMGFQEISSIINANLAELGPGVKGMNNHEGSEVTEDVIRIGDVIDVCTENGIYFLDSRTTANTKAPQAALERDIRIFEKSGPYIDNVVSREAMIQEIYKSLEAANRNGQAIVIAHVDKSANILPELLQEMYPYLVKAGYRFATPSTLHYN